MTKSKKAWVGVLTSLRDNGSLRRYETVEDLMMLSPGREDKDALRAEIEFALEHLDITLEALPAVTHQDVIAAKDRLFAARCNDELPAVTQRLQVEYLRLGKAYVEALED